MNENVVIAIMTGLGVLVTALCGAVATLWVSIRKQRIENQKADDESREKAVKIRKEEMAADAESTNDITKHLRAILKHRTEYYERDLAETKARHAAEIADIQARMVVLEKEIRGLRDENVKCREEAARQDEHSKNQDNEISRLRHQLLSTQSAVSTQQAVLERIAPDHKM